MLTTPVIRCLKTQRNVELHYLTKKAYQTILIPNPHVDKVWSIDKKVSEVLPQLKQEKFDYIIDLHSNLRTLQVKLNLGVTAFTFDKINLQKWMMVNFKVNWLPDIHIVDRYLKTVETLGVQNDGKGLEYFIPSKDEVQTITHQNQTIDLNQTEYIAFAIGAAHATKRLPTAKIIEICKTINQPIILLGGPSEQEEGQHIATQAGNHVINQCGHLNLHQSASIVQQAQKVITHDTGMMHIAAAFQKEIISIWGNTIPEFGMYPYYPKGVANNTSIQVSNLSCRPCSKIGYKQCPKDHFKCMNDIKLRIKN